MWYILKWLQNLPVPECTPLFYVTECILPSCEIELVMWLALANGVLANASSRSLQALVSRACPLAVLGILRILRLPYERAQASLWDPCGGEPKHPTDSQPAARYTCETIPSLRPAGLTADHQCIENPAEIRPEETSSPQYYKMDKMTIVSHFYFGAVVMQHQLNGHNTESTTSEDWVSKAEFLSPLKNNSQKSQAEWLGKYRIWLGYAIAIGSCRLLLVVGNVALNVIKGWIQTQTLHCSMETLSNLAEFQGFFNL